MCDSSDPGFRIPDDDKLIESMKEESVEEEDDQLKQTRDVHCRHLFSVLS